MQFKKRKVLMPISNKSLNAGVGYTLHSFVLQIRILLMGILLVNKKVFKFKNGE